MKITYHESFEDLFPPAAKHFNGNCIAKNVLYDQDFFVLKFMFVKKFRSISLNKFLLLRLVSIMI